MNSKESLRMTGARPSSSSPGGASNCARSEEASRAILGELAGSACDRLDSWKEIAANCKRSVRCVQRWERDEEMPVHRHVHAKASSVCAFKHEIDAWLQSRTRAASEPAPKEKCPERAAESLNPPLLAALRIPKSQSWLQNAAARVESVDLLQGENRIRLYFYVQLRGERDANDPLKNSVPRAGA